MIATRKPREQPEDTPLGLMEYAMMIFADRGFEDAADIIGDAIDAIMNLPSHSEDTAFEELERALAMFADSDNTEAVAIVQTAIDKIMKSPVLSEEECEGWDRLEELPHFTTRAFELHRQNGLTIEQVAQRLGLTPDEVEVHIATAELHVSSAHGPS